MKIKIKIKGDEITITSGNLLTSREAATYAGYTVAEAVKDFLREA